MDRKYISIQRRFHKNNYNEAREKQYFIEVDVQYPEKLHNFIIIYHFYLIINLHDKTEYVIRKKKFKSSIKLWISFKKFH